MVNKGFTTLVSPPEYSSTFSDRLQSNINQGIINSNKDTSRIVIANVLASDVYVTHGLGHIPTEWYIVGKKAQVDLWESATVNNNPTQVIILVASAIATVKIKFI